MFDAEDILSGLIRGAMSGRRKPWKRAGRAMRGSGLVNARTMLAAAGVAWGLYETWQQQQQPVAGAVAAPAGGGPGPKPAEAPATARAPQQTSVGQPLTAPPPLPDSAADEAAVAAGTLPPALLQLLRLMISAARADGEIGPAERERILGEAREVGAEADARRELESPLPLAEIVAAVSDPELKEQLYTLAFTIVRADESVTGGERIYLAQLAHRLGLEADTVSRLEHQAEERIDAAQ